MANEFLNRINNELKQKVRDKKMDEKDQIKTGLLSFMLDGVAETIVSGFKNALSSLKLPVPKVDVKPPEVNVTVSDIKIPEINVPEVKIPQIKVPEAKVTVDIPEIKVPEVKVPKITVPKPEVTVNVEKADAPIVEVPEVVMPDEMKVTGGDKPLPVHLVDAKGDSASLGGNSTSGGSNRSSLQAIVDKEAQDFALEAARGNVTKVSCVNKFGRSTDVDNGVDTDIWDGANSTDSQPIWVAPTQARTHIIHSRSVNDTSGGTGTRTIQVYGLKDWNTKEISETIVMGGTVSTVTTENQYVIIHRMKVLTKGASGPNVGTITATAETDNTVTAQIQEEQGQTQMAIYGIPSNQSAYMTQLYDSVNKSGGATGAIDGSLLYNPEPDAELLGFVIKHTIGKITSGTSDGKGHQFNPYKKFEGPGILKMQANGSANNLDVSAGFDLVLVDD